MMSFFLVVVVFSFHYRVLLILSKVIPVLKLHAQTQVLLIVLVLYMAHIVEIVFYAAAFYTTIEVLELGEFRGTHHGDMMSYLYYSGVIYTSLGIGDIYPIGHIRFVTSMETLSGLLLIAWSASFTFFAMGRLWKWKDC